MTVSPTTVSPVRPNTVSSPPEQLALATLHADPMHVAYLDELTKFNAATSGIEAAHGTISAILSASKTAVSSSKLSDEDTVKPIGDQVVNLVKSLKSGTTWADLVEQASSLADLVTSAFDLAVTAHAGDAQTEARKGSEALVIARDAALAMAQAYVTILRGKGRDVSSLVLPTPSGRLGSTTKSTGLKSSGLQFYSVVDGKEVVRAAPHCFRLGSIAWFDFSECGVQALKSALPADFAKGFAPLSVTAGGKTVTLGARIVDAD